MKYFSEFGLIPFKKDPAYIYNSKIIIIMGVIILLFVADPMDSPSPAYSIFGDIGWKLGGSLGLIIGLVIVSLPIYLYFKFIKKSNYSFFNNWTIPVLSFLYISFTISEIFGLI